MQMNNNREPGKIIMINGASSSGKSTLSRSLQQNLQEPFLHFSFDHLRETNVLPMERIHKGDIDWSVMRPAVFDGFHRCLPALAEAGNNLIVGHIIENEQWMSDLVQLLSSFDVYFVGVHCPLSELERRERERADRRTGEGNTDFHSVHRYSEYDFEVDSTLPNQINVEKLISAWRSRTRPAAFDRLAINKG